MIGKSIKEYRLSLNFTQKDLAQQIGLTPKMISYYERDERIPPIDIIIKLATIFNTSIDNLVGFNSANFSLGLSQKELQIIEIYKYLTDDFKAIAYGELLKLKKEQDKEKDSITKRQTHLEKAN